MATPISLCSIARRAGACVAAAWVALSIPPAAAQDSALVVARNTAAVSVSPAVADSGVAREIRISGNWVNGCAPVGASATSSVIKGQTVVTVELQIPLTLVACTQAITPYSLTASYTPTARGRLRVLVVSGAGLFAGQFLGEGVIDVRAPGDDHSRYDITGVWYDPSSNGSGLTFIHSRTADNSVFGTWYVYGADGTARWTTIQNTRWTGQGSVLEGDLLETRGPAIACLPLAACPAPYQLLIFVGRVRMVLSDANTARIEAYRLDPPPPPQTSVLFSGNLQRIQF